MKRLLLVLSVAGALFGSGQAHAQFANRAITGGVGFLDMDETAGFEWAMPLTIGWNGYIDNGFEYSFNVAGMLLSVESNQQVTGALVGSGFRYLFMEEELRPYLGLDVNYLHVFFSDLGLNFATNLVGVGPAAGVDYFVAPTLSVGLKGQFNVYWWLNQPVQTTKGLYLQVGAWF